MSADLEPEVPPRGEEIHLPGGSLHPILVTAGITIALLGLTTSLAATAVGVAMTVWVVALWIRDARREMAELPVHDEH